MLITLGFSLLASVVFVVFLQGPAGKLRRWIASRRTGWIRRRYVAAFVGAVRGKTELLNSMILASVVVLPPLLFGLHLLSVAATTRTQIAELKMRVSYPALEAANTDASAAIEGAGTREALLGEVLRSEPTWSLVLLIGQAVGVGLVLMSAALVVAWAPFAIARQMLAFEWGRFMLRIQALATKPELAELAVAEAGVHDEASLRLLVAKVSAIAERHKIEHIVRPFELWKAPSA